jgi:hypothetical protein
VQSAGCTSQDGVIDDVSLVKTRTNTCLSYTSAVPSYSVSGASPKVDAGGRAIAIMPLFAGFPLSVNITLKKCAFSISLLTDVVVLTPSDEILPSAYPSAKQNSATSTNQNLPSKFWKVTSVDLGAE